MPKAPKEPPLGSGGGLVIFDQNFCIRQRVGCTKSFNSIMMGVRR